MLCSNVDSPQTGGKNVQFPHEYTKLECVLNVCVPFPHKYTKPELFNVVLFPHKCTKPEL